MTKENAASSSLAEQTGSLFVIEPPPHRAARRLRCFSLFRSIRPSWPGGEGPCPAGFRHFAGSIFRIAPTVSIETLRHHSDVHPRPAPPPRPRPSPLPPAGAGVPGSGDICPAGACPARCAAPSSTSDTRQTANAAQNAAARTGLESEGFREFSSGEGVL